MIDKLIGNTPTVKIKYKYNNKERYVYSKLEYYNYTGSIKDRIAYNILIDANEKGLLKDGQIIVEATSGNTGISFAAIGALLKHPVHIFIPKSASSERINLLRLYGAKIHVLDNSYDYIIKEAEKFTKEVNGFMPNQFTNKNNTLTHYKSTAVEIIDKLKDIKIDNFVSGIGTGGTLMGIGKYLKEYDSNINVIALEPDSMPLLSSGEIKGKHRIEGIGDDFIPELVDKDIIDQVITINDLDAIMMSRKLANTFGLGVGISSGANFIGAVKSRGVSTVTVFADDAKKYLSTDLLKEFDDYNGIVNDIELISLEVI